MSSLTGLSKSIQSLLGDSVAVPRLLGTHTNTPTILFRVVKWPRDRDLQRVSELFYGETSLTTNPISEGLELRCRVYQATCCERLCALLGAGVAALIVFGLLALVAHGCTYTGLLTWDTYLVKSADTSTPCLADLLQYVWVITPLRDEL